MTNINIKIVGTDPFTKQLLVACNTDKSTKPLEEQPQLAYPSDFGGATNVEEFLVNIKDACKTIAERQDIVDGDEFLVDSWVGEVVAYTPEPTPETNNEDLSYEQKVARVRAERNKLLTKSDWTQLVDSPVDKATWATYRQGLRDLPATLSQENIDGVVYGVPPQ